MRNNKFKLASLLIIACIFFFASCKKEINNTANIPTTKEGKFDFNKFQRYSNDKVVQYQKNISNEKRPMNWMDWVTIGCADALGAAAGVQICTPLVPPWGSVAGGLVFGAAASYGCYIGLGGDPPKTSTGPNPTILNGLNPYDKIGIFHNRFVNLFIENTTVGDYQDLYDGFLNNVTELTNNELSQEVIIAAIPYDTFVATASLSMIFNGDPTNENDLELFMSKFSINVESSIILKQYFLDIQKIEKLGDATDFSKEIENYILNSGLNDNEKMCVLSSMSTFRNSINFWYEGTVN